MLTTSTDPESAVLGTMILYPDALTKGLNDLKPGVFESPRNRFIFETLKTIHSEGRPIDLVVLIDCLKEKGQLEKAGGSNYLENLAVNSPGGAGFTEHIKLLNRNTQKRLAQHLFEDLAFRLKNGEAHELLLDEAQKRLGELKASTTEHKKGLRSIELRDFLGMELPYRENVLSPWLPAQGLCMIHAARGVGKTFVGLGIAYAVASGGQFLGWKASKPAGVLYLDGEMPANVMQERLAEIVKASPYKLKAPLKLVTSDLQEHGMPDLGTIKGQEDINQLITDEIKLIIVDNLSCLVRTGKENEGDSWQPVQTWALGLRSRGLSVLFMHHSSKTGGQRGTSRREDVLDTVINLRRPPDYNPELGAVFEVHYEKSRGVHGKDAAPFETALKTDERGNQIWLTRSLDLCTYDKVVSLAAEGLSQKEIADELSLNKSTVSRHYRKAVADEKIKDKGSR